MNRCALLLVLLLGLPGCSGSSADLIPPGTWTGSTADDREFTMQVGDEIEVNRREATFVERGVLEVEEGPSRTTITCDLHENEEELRCEVTTERRGQSATTEVIDLMLL